MAFPLIDRALDALSDVFDGAAVSFDVDQPPPRTEDAPVGLYDVGQVVRQYTREWLGVAPNLVTPANLLSLLLTLDELTAQLEMHVAKHGPEHVASRTAKLGVMTASLPGLGAGLWMLQDQARRENERTLASVERDLQRWRIRLDDYIEHVEMAPNSQDRRAVLWEVTAPLFLGWFGGETGVEVPLPPGGVPETFDTEARHVADLSTPFRLANELGVWLEWDGRTKRLLVEDIEEETRKVIETAKDAAPEVPSSPLPYLLGGVAIGGVGIALLRRALK